MNIVKRLMILQNKEFRTICKEEKEEKLEAHYNKPGVGE
jgi:hypothetical protein